MTRALHAGRLAIRSLINPNFCLRELPEEVLHQLSPGSSNIQQPPARCFPRSLLHFLSSCSSRRFSKGLPHFGSSLALHRRDSCVVFRYMSTKSRVENRKKQDLARREFQLLRRKTKLMKASMSPEEKLLWRLRKANRKADVLHQRLKKYELEEDPEPVHDPELITTEQLHALKKIGYKNRNYVPVGRRGVYGGVVQNMHMHWKKHETVQVDCHTFKRPEIRPIARELAKLSGGIVIDIHQGTTIIMYRGRNYRQPKGEMIPLNTLSKRKALFKSKYLQALEGINKNIEEIQFELRALRRKAKERESQEGEDAINHEGEALSFKNIAGKGQESQFVEQNTNEESTITAAAELMSSDEDDGVFSWESDSLDEEELSDDEVDDENMDSFQHLRIAEVEKKGKVSTQHRNQVNEDDADSDWEDTGSDADSTQGIRMVEDQMGEKYLPFKRNKKGRGSPCDVPKKGPNVFKDDVLDESDETESDSSESYTDEELDEKLPPGISANVQMPAISQRNTDKGKREEKFKNRKKAKFEPDSVLDESSDVEENWEEEELEGFESAVERYESDNDTEGSHENRSGVMRNKKEQKP